VGWAKSCGANDPLAFEAAQPAVREGELRALPGELLESENFRIRTGRLHGRGAQQPGNLEMANKARSSWMKSRK